MSYTVPPGFEWDPQKYRQNVRSHRITFHDAARALDDPNAVEWDDDREEYGEARVISLCQCDGRILYVVYTERDDKRRIISARKALKHEAELYFQG